MQRNASPLHRVYQAVDCGMLSHFTTLAMLLDIGVNWNTLSYTSIQNIPNTLHEAYLVSMQAMGELGHFQLPGIV